MNTLKSIVVTVNDGTQDLTFTVDLNKDCALFWSDGGWDLLSKVYKEIYKNVDKEKKVKDKTCTRATEKSGTLPPVEGTVIALKTPGCTPSQWP